jgi:predicted translin family RNA/ssDNA-binding protein
MEQTPVPLLAIPETAHFSGLKKVVVALNLKELKERTPLHLLRKIIRVSESSVTALTVRQPGEEAAKAQEEIKANVEEMLEVAPSWVEMKSRNALKSIQEYVEFYTPGLLVLMPQP